MSSPTFYQDPSQLNTDTQQAIASIFVDNFTAAPRHEDWSQQSALDYLQSLWDKGALTWVSLDEQKIIGFAIGIPINATTQAHEPLLLNNYPQAFYLEEIAVSTNTQGKGIGKKLIKSTLTDTHSLYPSYVTRVRSDAPTMIRLLESFEFKQISSYTATKGGVSSQRLIYKHH